MQRHQSAIQTIGLATAGAMAGILAMSPTLRSELSGVRTAFSLMADTIVRDVLPGAGSLSEAAFSLQRRFSELSGPTRTAIGLLAVAATVAGLVATAFGGLIGIAAGLFVGMATLASKLGVLREYLTSLLYVVSPVTVLFMGLQKAVKALTGVSLTEWLNRGYQGLVNLGRAITNAPNRVRSAATDIRTAVEDRLASLPSDARQWGQDIIGNLIQGIQDRIPDLNSTLSNVRGNIEEHISFDRIANDRMARRWGEDLVSEFSAGVERGQSTTEIITPNGGGAAGLAGSMRAGLGGGGGGGTTINVTIERGAIQIRGDRTDGQTSERRVADEVGREFDERTAGRVHLGR
jgi:hypothetical protein